MVTGWGPTRSGLPHVGFVICLIKENIFVLYLCVWAGHQAKYMLFVLYVLFAFISLPSPPTHQEASCPSLSQVEHPVLAGGKTQPHTVNQFRVQFPLVLPLSEADFSYPYSGKVSVTCFPYPYSGEVSKSVRTECQTTVV